jgi:DNA-directed RNA polymerase II subunit RPB1
MEDLSVKYDGTVRNSNNTIIQFTYGDNGINTIKQSDHVLKTLEMGNKELADKIKFTTQELKNFKGFNKLNDEFYNNVLRLRNKLRKSRMKTNINNITFESNFMLPVNIKNIINNIKESEIKGDKLEPEYVINKLEDVLNYENTKVLSLNEKMAKDPNSLKYKDEELSKTVFRYALYEFMSPKACIIEYGLTKAKFDKICQLVIEKFNRAVVEPGEMVGVLAAQSIGEPKMLWVQKHSIANYTFIV